MWLQSGSTVLVWTEVILHIAKSDLQPGITVTDWLIPKPPYVSQTAYTKLFDAGRY